MNANIFISENVTTDLDPTNCEVEPFSHGIAVNLILQMAPCKMLLCLNAV